MIKKLKEEKNAIKCLLKKLEEKFNIFIVHILFGHVPSPPFLIKIKDKDFLFDLLELTLNVNSDFLRAITDENNNFDLELMKIVEKELKKAIRRELFLKKISNRYQFVIKNKKTKKEIPIKLFKG